MKLEAGCFWTTNGIKVSWRTTSDPERIALIRDIAARYMVKDLR